MNMNMLKRHHDQRSEAAAVMIQNQNFHIQNFQAWKFQAWKFQALLGDASRTSGSSVSGPVSRLGRPDGPTGMTDAVFEAGHFLGDR